MGPYNNKTDCFFCGQKVIIGSHGHDEPASEFLTVTFLQTVLGHCENRVEEWEFTVKSRIKYFGNDLHAADCIYHAQCSTNLTHT